MFSTLFNNHNFIFGDFLFFYQDAFKVVCCIIVVCGKVFKVQQMNSYRSLHEIRLTCCVATPWQHRSLIRQFELRMAISMFMPRIDAGTYMYNKYQFYHMPTPASDLIYPLRISLYVTCVR